MSTRSHAQASVPPGAGADTRGEAAPGAATDLPASAADPGAAVFARGAAPLRRRASGRRVRSRPTRYALAATFAAATLAASYALAGPLHGVSYSLPVAVVAILTYALGVGPGALFAVAVGLGYWFLVHGPSEDPHEYARLASYFAAALLLVVAIGQLRRTRRSLARRSAEARRAGERLRRSEAILTQAGGMAHLGAWWIELSRRDDLDANRLHWSDEVYRIFGYEPRSIAVTNELFFERVHPDDRARVRDALARAIAARRSYEIEHRVVRPDGEERVDLEHAEITFDDDGRPVRIVGAVQDVTDRKRAEQALLDADRRKDEFLGVLSHELRNPLAPIRNALWILERSPCGGEQARRATAVLNRQAVHLTRLVDDLLDVTRISRGKIELRRARVDVAELLRRTVDDHRSLFASREVALEVAIDGPPAWLDADATRVAQIVGNLLHNAAKFTSPGGRVRVALEREADAAVLRVGDDGVGIAPEMLSRVFEPFTQGDDSLHRSRGGLGLGLALVKGLVELHGGSVEARSAGLGRGAEVVVRLPMMTEQPAVHVDDAPAAPSMPPRRVLVVEDNVDAADTLRELLEAWGHTVEVAHDGVAALERARAFRPDVVLCDIGLPGMDGYAVARGIRADPALAATVLVALTGYALSEDQRRAADAGFSRHLSKPVPAHVLEDVLASLPRLAVA